MQATKDPEQLSLDALKAMRDSLVTKVQIKGLESELKAAGLASSWVGESFGQRVDMREPYTDGVGYQRFTDLNRGAVQLSRPEDKALGDNYPIWRTEYEHAEIRGIVRLLASMDEVAISALETITNYCVGGGLSYSAVPRSKAPTGSEKQLAITVSAALERFLDANKIEREIDREDFLRLHRDGENGIALIQSQGVIPSIATIDPSFIAEPDRPRHLEGYVGQSEPLTWKYGFASTFRDTSKFRWVFAEYNGDSTEWEVFPESRFVWTKINVDREVKRGLSDLFAVWQRLRGASKLLDNTVEGSAIQAAIALIRKHSKSTTNSEIEDFVGQQGSRRDNRKLDGGTESIRVKQSRPGTIIDAPNDGDVLAGPLGQLRQPVYIEIVQAALRMVGVRFQMPEYMISGDASNGNFASTLVSEAPFTKSAEAKQGLFVSKRKELCLKAIAMMCRSGVIATPFSEVMRQVEVIVEGPQVAVRDLDKAHIIHKEEYELGARSMESWREDAGLDGDLESRRSAAAFGAKPVSATTETDVVKTPKPEASPVAEVPAENTPRDVAQADMEAKSQDIQDRTRLAYPIIALVTAVSDGSVSRDSALEQLTLVYGFSDDQALALIGSTKPAEPK